MQRSIKGSGCKQEKNCKGGENGLWVGERENIWSGFREDRSWHWEQLDLSHPISPPVSANRDVGGRPVTLAHQHNQEAYKKCQISGPFLIFHLECSIDSSHFMY